jgi:hypothetical protein
LKDWAMDSGMEKEAGLSGESGLGGARLH